jgi:hypothetical protein
MNLQKEKTMKALGSYTQGKLVNGDKQRGTEKGVRGLNTDKEFKFKIS